MMNLWRRLRQEDVIDQVTSERDYLDAKCAEFEDIARKFVNFVYPDFICREHTKVLLENWREVKR